MKQKAKLLTITTILSLCYLGLFGQQEEYDRQMQEDMMNRQMQEDHDRQMVKLWQNSFQAALKENDLSQEEYENYKPKLIKLSSDRLLVSDQLTDLNKWLGKEIDPCKIQYSIWAFKGPTIPENWPALGPLHIVHHVFAKDFDGLTARIVPGDAIREAIDRGYPYFALDVIINGSLITQLSDFVKFDEIDKEELCN